MITYAYFGSSKVSIYVLDELLKAGFKPNVVVTTPDKPQGRGLTLTPNIMKTWALERGLTVIDDQTQIMVMNPAEMPSLFIVASYGKILPKALVFAPKYKTLNVHPSLLPAYRGAAPLPQTILDDTKETGVTIMRLDEKMDHGPIIAQKPVTITEWPTYEVFEEQMAREGGKVLAQIMPDWVAGKIPEQEQDHAAATYTRKITKEDALLDLSSDASLTGEIGYANFRKIQAYHEWPQAYFMGYTKKGQQIRVKITGASFESSGNKGARGPGGKLVISEVLPEGSRRMKWSDYLQGYSRTPLSC
jgi:methionyl-tRNA formyltransferase